MSEGIAGLAIGSSSSSPSSRSASSRRSGCFFGFMAQRPADYAETGPAFDLRAVLDGPLIASGVIYGPTGRVATRFVADMQGTWDAAGGTLAEDFRYDTGRTQQRVWHLMTAARTGASPRRPTTWSAPGEGESLGRHRRSCATACACPRTPAAGRSTSPTGSTWARTA